MTRDLSDDTDSLEESSPPGRVWKQAQRAYRLQNRFAGWKTRLKELFAWLETKTGLAAAGALASGGVVGAVLIANTSLTSVRHMMEAPVEHWGEAVVFPVDGVDLAGRRASFDLVLMPKDYTWALGSSTSLAYRGDPLDEAETTSRVFSVPVREGLSHSPEIIAVGAASQEGDLESEQSRAERRAKTQAQRIAKSVSPLTRIWTLNLGQYNEACSAANTGDTSWQRPVMFVGVRFQHPGVVLVQALENAISGKTNVPSRECYSSFEMTPSQ